MKKTLIAVLILGTSTAGICLAGSSSVGSQPNSSQMGKPMPTYDSNANSNSYTNSVND